ncbi:MAG: hypothetical protein IKF82_00890 [Bacilli bacterium]|nr:hypothetical protein [Bacilli bacterium]
MDEMFLQELNAITNYANSSNTNFTEEIVREMLTNLVHMERWQLYGTRCCPFDDMDKQVKKDKE